MWQELMLFPTVSQRFYAVWCGLADLRLRGRFLSPREIAVVVAAMTLFQVVLPICAPRSPAAAYGLAVLQCAFFGWVLALPVVHGMRRTIRRELVESGIIVCWHCGHDLRGTPDAAVCPECGYNCTEPLRKLQHYLPEAATFPELHEFASEAEAAAALEFVRKRLGGTYSRRLLYAGCIGLYWRS